jgi:SagB-type dehydrogenase family enzyme
MADDETFFDKFWESSSLDKFNVQQFAQQLESYDSDNKELLLEYPEAPQSLPQARSQVNKIAKKRKSDRVFSGNQLSLKEFGRLLSSFYAWNGLEHRGYPSAGATYVTEIFCVMFNVEGFADKIIYYDPEKHGAVTVSDKAPSWDTASKSLNMNIEGTPNLLLIFVTFPDRAVAKYGDRGGRFALLEVGAALQQLSLQIAESSKLKGVAVGGMLDEIWKQTLNLEQTDARIALGYLIGN